MSIPPLLPVAPLPRGRAVASEEVVVGVLVRASGAPALGGRGGGRRRRVRAPAPAAGARVLVYKRGVPRCGDR